MPEIIRADNLLNILWLSSPQIEPNMITNELGDIGLTSLVTMTLNKSLPKARIIRALDENIQKYSTEDVSERDVLMLSTRIVNYHLSSDDVDALNKEAQLDRQEFSRRIKEEAAKEEVVLQQQGEKINEFVARWQVNMTRLLDGQKETIKSVRDLNGELQASNNQKDEEIRKQKERILVLENEIRKEKREKYVKAALKKWRRWPTIWLICVLFFFLMSVIWLVFSFVYEPETNELSQWEKVLNSQLFSVLFTVLMGFISYFVIKTFHDRKCLDSNINSFIDHLVIPDDMRELMSIDELD